MIIETFECGPVATNAYLVADKEGGFALFVDAPIGSSEQMLERAKQLKVKPVALVNTHGHWDHTGENAGFIESADMPLLIHADDEPMISSPQMQARYFFGLPLKIKPTKASRFIQDGDTIAVGTLSFLVLHVPGHTRGHIALFEPKERVLFCGDLLFAGSVGRTDLPGGDWDTLVESIHEKIFVLPDDTVVYPGHGPTTMIGHEKQTNPFV